MPATIHLPPAFSVDKFSKNSGVTAAPEADRAGVELRQIKTGFGIETHVRLNRLRTQAAVPTTIQIEVFTGTIIILLIAWLSIRWIGASRHSDLFMVGSLWLVLTVAFEVLFGRLVMNLSWQRLLADYNVIAGGLMPLGLAVLLFAPWMASKIRPLRKHQANPA